MFVVKVAFGFEGLESDADERTVMEFMNELALNDVLATAVESAIGAYEDTDRWPEHIEFDGVEVL